MVIGLIIFFFIAFTALDVGAFVVTPHETRMKYWWRYLPGGGLAVLVAHWRQSP